MTWKCWRGRATVAVVASALSWAAGGCAGDKVAADHDVNFDVKAKPTGTTAGPGAAVTSGYDEMPTPPKGAAYTIYCQAYAGPDHQEVARRVRDVLRANTSLGKWYVVHGDQQSTLYYGFYRAIDKHLEHESPDDVAEAQRAIDDLDAIRTLHNSQGMRLFSASLPVSIDSPDPTANPAWDITRSGAYWSLEVAVFKDTPDRKLRAVEAVAEARQQGFDAYYYHGPHASSVCIGAWPKAAADEVDVADQNVDPDRPLMVTNAPLSPDFAKGLDPNMQTAAPHVDPVDPSMIQALDTWKSHAVNGYVRMQPDPVTHQATDVPLDRPFLFKVQALIDAGGDGMQVPMADTASANVAPDAAAPPPAAPGSGHLRGLDDSN
jgi:hypothetical protein